MDVFNPGFSTQGGLIKLALILTLMTSPLGIAAIVVGLLTRTRTS
ncbi:MAG TPA: hypothetical protein VGE01_05935 [Fimbriimonas sp.]